MSQVHGRRRARLLGLLSFALLIPSFLKAQSVLTTITTGAKTGVIAVNETTNKVYVATDSSLTVIDGATNGTQVVGGLWNPFVMAVDPGTNRIYVGNNNGSSSQSTVTVVYGTTLTTRDITIGKAVSAVAVNSKTNRVYAANSQDNTVSVINGDTYGTTTLAAGASPLAIGVNPVTNKIYVVNYLGNSVTVIDGATNATSTVKVGTLPFRIAVNSVTNKIYVLNSVTSLQMSVTEIDGATNSTSTIVLGTTSDGTPGSQDIAVNTAANKIYVTAGTDSSNLGRLNIIDGATKTITAKLTVGYKPQVVAVNPKTNKIYVANDASNTVSVVDGATNKIATLTVGSDPAHMAINTATDRVYVANQGSGTVSVIGTAAVATTTTVTADVNPQYFGSNVTFTAYVAPKSGTAIPSGNLTFSIDGTNVVTKALDGTGHATYATSTLTVGAHTVKASYVPTGNFTASTGSLTETITAVAAATPVFTPAAGTYYATQTITISDSTPGAVIYYTSNGTTPTTASTKYVAPVSIAKTTTLKAIAVATGYSTSAVATGVYTITIGVPKFTPAPGNYYGSASVTLADATPGATIYYTLDGTTPTTASTKYAAAIALSKTTTIKAIGYSATYGTSTVATGVYTILPPLAATPAFDVKPATYVSTRWVNITDAIKGSVIYYTTNGTTPTTASTKFVEPITVSATTTLKAIAVASGYSNSTVATGVFTILPPAWTPTFSLAAGTYKGTQTIRIGDVTPGAVIYYTTDGTTPTTASTKYLKAFTISATTTVKALVVATGYSGSAVATATYTITP